MVSVASEAEPVHHVQQRPRERTAEEKGHDHNDRRAKGEQAPAARARRVGEAAAL